MLCWGVPLEQRWTGRHSQPLCGLAGTHARAWLGRCWPDLGGLVLGRASGHSSCGWCCVGCGPTFCADGEAARVNRVPSLTTGMPPGLGSRLIGWLLAPLLASSSLCASADYIQTACCDADVKGRTCWGVLHAAGRLAQLRTTVQTSGAAARLPLARAAVGPALACGAAHCRLDLLHCAS